MTDLTKYRSSYNPWIIGFPSLPAVRPGGDSRRQDPKRRPWIARLRCRLHRDAIDQELAAGADPNSSECRHRRAAELTTPSERRKLAAVYERLVVQSASPPMLSAAPVNWQGVRAATPRLVMLAAKLRANPRVRAQGVAQARLLVTSGTSSLYLHHDESRLVDEVRSALALL